jgi:hypothetical protein
MSGLRKNKVHLSKAAFWDVDLENLDIDRYAKFIIFRVLEKGTESDLQEIIKYYGSARIINNIVTEDNLMPRTIALAKKTFHLSDTDLACSKHKQQAHNYFKY